MLKNYKDLMVWQKSYDLCLQVYKTTYTFPKEEKYGLVIQMRRSAVSIPSNIAEGYGKKTIPDYVRSLYSAYGSTCELETQLHLCGDLGYAVNKNLEFLKDTINEVELMLKSLITSLEKKHIATQILESLSADRQA
jgi:four helix bundle protein